jgi:hypothetical protein
LKADQHPDLPASWLYALFAIRRLWGRLNTGDRAVLSLTALFVAAIPVMFGVQLGGAVARLPSHFGGMAIGLFTCVVVSFLVTGTMTSMHGHRYFAFLPETSRRKVARIGLEFAASCLLSLMFMSAIIAFVPKLQSAVTFTTAFGTALVGHGIVHAIQFLFRTAPLRSTSAQTLTGMTRRNLPAPFLASAGMIRLPKSSSRFLLKANSNPLLWAFLILTALSSGGAAIAWKSPLFGLSTLSTLLFVLQCALMEPRVGNGPTIGAHSGTLPIKRARQDLWALAFPHLVCLIIALALMVFEWNATHAAIAASQFLLTLWILWLFLVMGALPSEDVWRTYPVATVLGIIAYNILPPILLILLAIGTIMITRDLMRLSLKGPATWPR